MRQSVYNAIPPGPQLESLIVSSYAVDRRSLEETIVMLDISLTVAACVVENAAVSLGTKKKHWIAANAQPPDNAVRQDTMQLCRCFRKKLKELENLWTSACPTIGY